MHQCKQCWEHKPLTRENFKKMNSRYCNACLDAGLVIDRRAFHTSVPVAQKPTCHPERKHAGHGYCNSCYMKNYTYRRFGYGKPVEGSNI
jgi:hypothetical protein